MPEYDNTNRGALFKNQYKKAENHPDYRGPLNVDGKELEVAAWVRKSKDGKTFMSLSVSEPYDKTQSEPQQTQPEFEPDTEIPF